MELKLLKLNLLPKYCSLQSFFIFKSDKIVNFLHINNEEFLKLELMTIQDFHFQKSK